MLNYQYYLSTKLILLLFLIFYPHLLMASNKYDTSKLSDLQKYVTLENGTEQPFNNKYWNNKEEGIYVVIISMEVLFSSKDKFDSNSGWPSFTKPINNKVITTLKDNSHNMTRIEVRSAKSDAHLGHVFNDGPIDDGDLRYCINSASLKFIPKDKMAENGYEKYLYLFDKNNNHIKQAILAGGCFWGMEHLFANLKGVIDVVNGYSGGDIANPGYKIVSSGISGHAESIKIIYDSTKISYENILRFFLQIHDPTQLNRQQNDIGTQYRSAIFYQDQQQKEIAQNIIKLANDSGKFPGKIVTEITKFKEFYQAEQYHQDYLAKNPNGYSCHKIRDDWQF
jgi:peptide methionine sulfoxide reductase msrA/msrB